jgi:hypothetical protein
VHLSHRNKFGIIAGTALLGCIPGVSQAIISNQATIDLDDGTSPLVAMKLDKRIGFGPAQPGGSAVSTGTLPFYTANYTSLRGKQLTFNIVGTDPSLGANTTTVPTVIVPLKFVFSNAGNPTLDGTNVVAATQNSPLFLTADYTTGGTDVGTTQYGDAIQRAEFWNLPGFSQNYHVLLGTPATAPTVTITVPAGLGNAFRLRNGGLVGVVDDNYFSSILTALLPGYSASQLPIFTTDNVFLGANGLIGNCCVLGFHDSQGPPAATAQTWIYAAYTEPGTFGGNVILDVQPLSHETAEWLNDPFVGIFTFDGTGINLIPPAVLPGQGGVCIINFETGDPLEAPPVVFTQITNSTTYHLQDEVFLPWYLHSVPSFSVNGWYTFLNAFPSFSTLCGPG